MFMTSLYADDVAIFLVRCKKDVQKLASIPRGFGEVTGLCTNFHKSSVVHIRCDGLNLDDILYGILSPELLFRSSTLVFLSRSVAFEGMTFNPLKTRRPGRSPLGMGNLSRWRGEPLLSSPSSTPTHLPLDLS
jgi:hypothetical protein